MIFPASTNRAGLRVVRPHQPVTFSQPAELYPETRSQFAWRAVCLGCAAFWLVVIVWWAA